MPEQVATLRCFSPRWRLRRRTIRRSHHLWVQAVIKFSVEMTPVTCDADLRFSQVTPASRGTGGGLPSPSKQLEFECALDFYTPIGASGAHRSVGLQLIESPIEEDSPEESHSVACELVFMEDDDLVTSADETITMGVQIHQFFLSVYFFSTAIMTCHPTSRR